MSKKKTKKAKPAPLPRLKVMVASTIYGFKTELEQICAVLDGYGYHVLNSDLGTIPVDPAKGNLDNCLAAVDSCDLMLGIIRPFYGTGVVGPRSITHEEMRRAVEQKRPRWFVVHAHVPLVRQVLKQFRYDASGAPRPGFTFERTAVFDDVRVIDMYEEVIAPPPGAPPKEHHWAQEFIKLGEILTHIEAQFRDMDRIRSICQQMGKL